MLTATLAAGAAELEARSGDRHLDHWTTLLTMQRDGAQGKAAQDAKDAQQRDGAGGMHVS